MSGMPDLYEMMVLKALPHIKYGSLHVTFPDKTKQFYKGTEEGPEADITLQSRNALKALITRGDNGWAESYIDGEWDSDNLDNFMRFVCVNAAICEQFYHGNVVFRWLAAILHRMRPNTKKGSKRNIEAHYDLGNDFYKLWLDDTMTYSSGIYHGDDMSLEDAQRSKYDRLLTKMESGSHILEIGCGWGGFAERAAEKDMQVTGLTISPAQADFAKQRLLNKGVSHWCEVLLKDYRDIRGKFDHIVSIEMFEAVGEKFWKGYFSTIQERLKEGGKALIQTITIADDVYPEYRKRGDFIQHHIFPGGMLPSKLVFADEVKKSGMRIEETYSFGKDYARTLSEWLKRFDANAAEIVKMGYPQDFIRKWRFYLAYCAGAFASGRTDVVQYELQHA